MSKFDWFVQLLGSTFTQTNNEERHAGEIKISELISQSPDEFVLLTSAALAEPNIRLQVKQYASAAFLQTFRLKKKDKRNELWLSLKPDTMNALLNAAFDLMVNQNDVLKRQGATLLAQLYLLDITSPTPIFSNTILSGLNCNLKSNSQFRKVSLFAISQICQEMSPQRLSQLPTGELEVLLGGIAETLNITDESPTLIIKSISSAMAGFALKFDNESFLRFVLERVMTFLALGIDSKDLELVCESINCLGQVVKFSYHNLGPYTDVLFQRILELDDINDSTLRSSTCEFWVKCFRMEEMCKTNFIDGFSNILVKNCFQRLLEAVDLVAEEQETSIDHLEGISRLLNFIMKHFENTVSIVIEFIQAHNTSKNLAQVVCSMIAIDSILDLKGDISKPVCQFFPNLLNYIVNYDNVLVKTVAFKCVIQMITKHVFTFFKFRGIPEMIKELLLILMKPEGSQTVSKYKILTCSIFDAIASKSIENHQFTITLQEHVSMIMDTFLKVITFTNDISVIDAIFASIFDFFNFVLSPNQLEYYLPKMFDMFNQIGKGPQGSNTQIFMESVIIDINVGLSRLLIQGQHDVFESHESQSFLNNMLMRVAQFHSSAPQFSVESLTLMTTILTSAPKFFHNYVLEFFEKFVKGPLVSPNELTKMTAAVLSFTAIIRAFPHHLKSETKEFIHYLMSLMVGDFPKEIRIPVYYFLSDVMINDPDLAREFGPRILELDRVALERIVHFGTEESIDDDTFDFCNQLKDVIIENIFCYLHGLYPLNDMHITNKFESEFKRIEELLTIMIADKFAIPSSPNFVKSILNFLLDSMSRLRNPQMVDQNLIEFCWNKLDKGDPEYSEVYSRLVNMLGHKI